MEHEEGGWKKRKKHAIKIPSSLGLFIVDSSCFFVSGPEVQREREREEGEEEERQQTKFKKIAFANKNRGEINNWKIKMEKDETVGSVTFRWLRTTEDKLFTRITLCFLKR